MKRFLRIVAGVCALGCAGCAADEGYPPVARIALAPPGIPENDEFRTELTLDGTASSDPLDDPEGGQPLSFRWEIDGDEYRVEDGGLTAPTLAVRMRGSRPATVRLEVTDGDGLSGSTEVQVQLTARGLLSASE